MVNQLKVIITGATSGIGRELARILCRDGRNIVLGVGRNVDALNDLARELRNCIIPLQADLSKLSGVERVVEVASRTLGEVDLLVNNAGFGLYKGIIEHTDEEALSMIMVNFTAPILLTKKLLHLLKAGSTVVFIITAGVHVLMESLPLYGASKAGLHYAVKALRKELRDRGIKVLAVYPGVVKSSFHERAGFKVESGLDPARVASEVIKAIEKGKAEIYIPRYMAIAKLLSPLLLDFRGPAKAKS